MSFLFTQNSEFVASSESNNNGSYKRSRLDDQQHETWQPSSDSQNQPIPGEISMEESIQKLNQLSLEERNQALDDLHGVASEVEETPEMIVQKLNEFSRCISESKHLSESLVLALDESPHYVLSLRLAFLRVERFCVPRAVSRMSNHFESRGKLFGRESLFRPLRLDDLSSQDREYFEQGGLQILPRRDRSGRAIAFIFGRITSTYPVNTTLRIFQLNCYSAIQDVEVQKSGFILVHYGFGQKKFNAMRTMMGMKELQNLPIRLEGIHGCYEDPMLSANYNLATHIMETVYMCRCRIHGGTMMECNYKLMTFGIPVKDVVPIRDDGTMDLTDHQEWVQTLKFLQSQQEVKKTADGDSVDRSEPNDEDDARSISNSALIPSTRDVIMGRGRHGKDMAGNQRFKHLVQEYKHDYDAADRSNKKEVVDAVLKDLNSFGTRFLKRNEKGGWIQVSDTEVRSKISHAFRNLRVTPSSNATVTRVRGQKREGGFMNQIAESAPSWQLG